MSKQSRVIPINADERLELILEELLAIKGRLSSIESRLAAQQPQEQSQNKKTDSMFGFPETHE